MLKIINKVFRNLEYYFKVIFQNWSKSQKLTFSFISKWSKFC